MNSEPQSNGIWLTRLFQRVAIIVMASFVFAAPIIVRPRRALWHEQTGGEYAKLVIALKDLRPLLLPLFFFLLHHLRVILQNVRQSGLGQNLLPQIIGIQAIGSVESPPASSPAN